jgi:hypothetical protein
MERANAAYAISMENHGTAQAEEIHRHDVAQQAQSALYISAAATAAATALMSWSLYTDGFFLTSKPYLAYRAEQAAIAAQQAAQRSILLNNVNEAYECMIKASKEAEAYENALKSAQAAGNMDYAEYCATQAADWRGWEAAYKVSFDFCMRLYKGIK